MPSYGYGKVTLNTQKLLNLISNDGSKPSLQYQDCPVQSTDVVSTQTAMQSDVALLNSPQPAALLNKLLAYSPRICDQIAGC